VTTWAVRRAGSPVGVLLAIVIASGVLSALFVKDVICVVLAPLVVTLTRRLGLPPAPYLIALATAANVGSVATLTGNPQNMLVGSFSGISYRRFLLHEAPVAATGLGCVFGVVWAVYRRRLPAALDASSGAATGAVHYPIMTKTVLAVGVMLAAFLAMASTLAGNLTLVGSVADLIVVESARGEGVRIGMAEYCRVGVPVTLLTLLLGWLIL